MTGQLKLRRCADCLSSKPAYGTAIIRCSYGLHEKNIPGGGNCIYEELLFDTSSGMRPTEPARQKEGALVGAAS